MNASTSEKPQPELEKLLAEFQMAQDSAHHHDTLYWTSIGVTFGSMLVLLGFVLGSLDKPDVKGLLRVISLLGIALTVFTVVFAFQFNAIKRGKYERCREIEGMLGTRLHKNLPHLPVSQRIALVILAVFFFAPWMYLLWWLG